MRCLIHSPLKAILRLGRLTTDLAEAEQYREAYCNMVDEVDALVRRNALAEDEARSLSKFNAQILGHRNPAQRIMYVDKIRQELHDTKQASPVESDADNSCSPLFRSNY